MRRGQAVELEPESSVVSEPVSEMELHNTFVDFLERQNYADERRRVRIASHRIVRVLSFFRKPAEHIGTR